MSTNTITKGRQPLSVLAVQPRTRAPPPLPVQYQPPKSPTILGKGILPVPNGPNVPNVPNGPMIPQIPKQTLISPKIPTTSQPLSTFTLSRQGPSYSPLEGQLIPIVPLPYEDVGAIPNQLSGTNVPGIQVVLPTVSKPYVPIAVPEIDPKLPPQVPLSPILRNQTKMIPRTASISRNQEIFSRAEPVSYPALMTGMNPPIGEETPMIVPINHLTITPDGVVEYSTPVDISTFALSQESSPLPLEESYQPAIISAEFVPISIPTPPSMPQLPTVLKSPEIQSVEQSIQQSIDKSASPFLSRT